MMWWQGIFFGLFVGFFVGSYVAWRIITGNGKEQ